MIASPFNILLSRKPLPKMLKWVISSDGELRPGRQPNHHQCLISCSFFSNFQPLLKMSSKSILKLLSQINTDKKHKLLEGFVGVMT